MAIPRFAWGIDVGNRALKAVKLVRDGDTLRIDDVDVIEHEHILSDAGDNKESLVTQSLNTFAQKHPEKGGAVAIGVSGQSSFARFIKLPPVEDKRIPEIVRFEAIQQIPFPLDDVEWSYQLFQDEGSPEKEVGIFAMRKELVNLHIKNFTDAGLNVQAVQMNPLAVYNAMYHDERIKGGGATMIVDVGAENTDLIIAEGEQIWLRSIPVGGNNFTESLVKQFKLKFPKAEELKRNAATSKYTRQILQAMRPVFDSLVSEIQRSIGFYASVHRESKIGRVLALGGTFRLPGLLKFLQMQLQLDVQRLDALAAAPPADARVATLMNDNLLSLAAPYGLALQVMDQAKINSSLLPLAIRRARMWREKTKWFAAAAALILCGTGVALGRVFYEGMRYDGGADARSKVSTEFSRGKALDTQWKEVESAGSDDRTNIAKMQGTTLLRGLQAEILLAVDKALPEPPLKPEGNRPERKVVMVENLIESYVDDLKPVLELTQPEFIAKAAAGTGGRAGGAMPMMNMGGGGPGGARPNAAAGMANMTMGGGGDTGTATEAAPVEVDKTKVRGYLMTIVCTTPMPQRAATTIAKAVQQALIDQTKVDPTSTVPQKFRIERVEIVSVRKAAVEQDQRAPRRRAPAAKSRNPRGRGAGRAAQNQRSAAGPRQSNPGAMAAAGMGRMGQGIPPGDPNMAASGMGRGAGAGSPYGAGAGAGSPYGAGAGAGAGRGAAARSGGAGRVEEPEGDAPAFEMPALNFDEIDANAAAEEENTKPTDPVTGEDASADQRVTFLVAVVLDPPLPTAPEGAEGASGTEAAGEAPAEGGPPAETEAGGPPDQAGPDGVPPEGTAPEGTPEGTAPEGAAPATTGDAPPDGAPPTTNGAAPDDAAAAPPAGDRIGGAADEATEAEPAATGPAGDEPAADADDAAPAGKGQPQ